MRWTVSSGVRAPRRVLGRCVFVSFDRVRHRQPSVDSRAFGRLSLDESILKYMGGTSANSLAHILQPKNTEEHIENMLLIRDSP